MIVLLNDIKIGISKHNLYYYKGNFYYPIFVEGFERGRVRRAIREFKKVNQGLIESDRAEPGYKSKLQEFDDQFPNG